jgi:hypothetical protein
MAKKTEKQFLLELYDEMCYADDFMIMNSPSEFAFSVPLCTIINRLLLMGVPAKRLGIELINPKVVSSKGKKDASKARK